MKAIDDPDELKYVLYSPSQVSLSRCSRLRKALTSALKAASAEQEPDPRTHFHEQFRKEAAEYDRDFLKKYHDDLNTALIFVGRLGEIHFLLPKHHLGRSLFCRSIGLHRRDPTADEPRLRATEF